MRTHRLFRCSALIAAALLGTAAAASAQVEIASWGTTKLFLGVDTVGTLQALEQENVFDASGNEIAQLEPGFQTAWGNLEFAATFGEDEELEMFFDLLISSRNHPSTTYGHQGYLLVRGMPGQLKENRLLSGIFRHVNLKVGHFHIDYGDHGLHRSDNAAVQSNPLIGNFVIDPEIVDIGAEITSKPGRFNWLLGVSNGTNTEDFKSGRGTALHGKVWLDVQPVRASFSMFQVDHADNPTGATGSRTTLFAGNRDGERYGGVWGGGQAPGQVLPQAGKQVTAWQADVAYTWQRLKLYANYGDTEDADANGSLAGTPVENWIYYTGEAVYQLTPKAYVAARYSAAEAKKLAGLDSDGFVERIQVGGGYWLTDNILGKLEYVTQGCNDFLPGTVMNGVQSWKDPA
ncbi:MAG: hypothetical protein ACRD2T_02405, partial [Thermoanaerobaculia bacterium]